MKQELIDLALNSNPYKIDLDINDYDEGEPVLEMAIWKDIYTMLEFDILAKGSPEQLRKILVDTYNLFASKGIDCEYSLEVNHY